MTGFTNRQQKLMYYQRKRRRTLRTVPRLSQVACPAANSGPSTGFVQDAALVSPISFLVCADLSSPGVLFTWGNSIRLETTSTNVVLTFPDGSFTADHPGSGLWRMILSIRPADGAIQLWNQFGSLIRTTGLNLAGGAQWAANGEALTVGDLAKPLGLYTLQLPQHFQNDGVLIQPDVDPASGDFWLNSTALFFMSGFPTPLFEGDC